jgi:hypothetical protein
MVPLLPLKLTGVIVQLAIASPELLKVISVMAKSIVAIWPPVLAMLGVGTGVPT